jgi:hypothetical protein
MVFAGAEKFKQCVQVSALAQTIDALLMTLRGANAQTGIIVCMYFPVFSYCR